MPRGTIPVECKATARLLGDTIVVVGDRRTSILHEFLIDGKPLRDFGAPVDNETHEASAIDASGLVSCVRERHVVLFTSSLIQIRAYSTAGQLLWSHIVPGLRQVVVKHDPDGGADPAFQLGAWIKLSPYSVSVVALLGCRCSTPMRMELTRRSCLT